MSIAECIPTLTLPLVTVSRTNVKLHNDLFSSQKAFKIGTHQQNLPFVNHVQPVATLFSRTTSITAVTEVDEDLLCGICLDKLKRAVRTVCCRNMLCEAEASQLKRCPYCRDEPFRILRQYPDDLSLVCDGSNSTVTSHTSDTDSEGSTTTDDEDEDSFTNSSGGSSSDATSETTETSSTCTSETDEGSDSCTDVSD